ncbi:MAG: glycoside hydrolase family 5 protein [Armatimonadota bacterium]|nr:glycoside hydrolase family 5 protein [Armatimonadota bacterium]
MVYSKPLGFCCSAFLISSLLTFPREAFAQHPSIPSPIVSNPFGVNIHFTDPKSGEMKMLAEGGFGWVRMDFGWGGTEKEKGQYDFSAYDRLIVALETHKIRALFILDYSNRLYDEGLSPHTDEGRQAFAKWAAAAAQHFQGRGILWEMYNEPNIGFWKPKPNVDDYVKLALAVGKAIRAATPGEAYIGPATSTIDFKFLEACFKGGLLEYWDAVSVHPYRQNDPETATEELRRLRLLIAKYAPKGKMIPILSGEWGYSSVWGGMDAEKQGRRLPRQWLNNLANDVPLSIWYDWHDDGTDPKEPEHHFGTVAFPYHEARDPVYDPKPAYLAAKTLTTALKGFRFNKRLAMTRADDYVLLFSKDNDVRLAVWTTSLQPHSIVVPASRGTFRVTAHTGEELPVLTADEKGLSIDVTDAPKYLTPEAPNDLLRVAAAWQRAPLEVVADASNPISIDLALANPLLREIRFETQQAARGPRPRSRSQSTSVLPGTRASQRVVVNPTRSAEPIRVPFELKLSGMGPSAQRVAQETQIIVTNPLIVTLLPPSATMLPVRVENPSGEAFAGQLWLSRGGPVSVQTEKRPLEFKQGEAEKILSLSASNGPLWINVEDANRHVVLTTPHTTLQPVDDFAHYADAPLSAYKILPDGDPKVPSEQTIAIATPPEGLPVSGTGALKISYRFDPGWKFIRLVPQDEKVQKVEGQPKMFGLWIYGDGEGNLARLRFMDSTGQTFQPGGHKIDWKGWRYVTFPLDGADAGHWGGANDGVIHYPIKWDTLFLLDNPSRGKTQGEIYISGPTLIY